MIRITNPGNSQPQRQHWHPLGRAPSSLAVAQSGVSGLAYSGREPEGRSQRQRRTRQHPRRSSPAVPKERGGDRGPVGLGRGGLTREVELHRRSSSGVESRVSRLARRASLPVIVPPTPLAFNGRLCRTWGFPRVDPASPDEVWWSRGCGLLPACQARDLIHRRHIQERAYWTGLRHGISLVTICYCVGHQYVSDNRPPRWFRLSLTTTQRRVPFVPAPSYAAPIGTFSEQEVRKHAE